MTDSKQVDEKALVAATEAVTAEIDRYWKDDTVEPGHRPVAEAAIRAYLSALPAAPMPGVKATVRPLELKSAELERYAHALHALDCYDAAEDYRREKQPVPEKFADPWLPTGIRQLEILRKRAAVLLSALDVSAHPEGVKALRSPRDWFVWLREQADDTGAIPTDRFPFIARALAAALSHPEPVAQEAVAQESKP